MFLASAALAAPAPARALGQGSSPGDSAFAASPDRTLLAAGATVSVRLDLSMGQPVVDVILNGKGPFRMFLDTGAGATVLDQSLATELGLAPSGKTRLGDPANPQAISADIV